MRRLALGLVGPFVFHPARAQVSTSESKLLDSLDSARALALMNRLSGGVVSNHSGADAPARIAKLEAQAETYLREALFIVTGRLERATRALSQTPVPRGGTG